MDSYGTTHHAHLTHQAKQNCVDCTTEYEANMMAPVPAPRTSLQGNGITGHNGLPVDFTKVEHARNNPFVR